MRISLNLWKKQRNTLVRFEEIAEELSILENRKVSVNAVRILYYKAINKLRDKVRNDPELEKTLRELITEDIPEQPLIQEIMLELEDDN